MHQNHTTHMRVSCLCIGKWLTLAVEKLKQNKKVPLACLLLFSFQPIILNLIKNIFTLLYTNY